MVTIRSEDVKKSPETAIFVVIDVAIRYRARKLQASIAADATFYAINQASGRKLLAR
jgi:hypothetical protein